MILTVLLQFATYRIVNPSPQAAYNLAPRTRTTPLNVRPHQPASVALVAPLNITGDLMPTRYRVTSDATELPRGSSFIIQSVAVKTGDLVLVAICGKLIIARWCPTAPCGANWISRPGRVLRINSEIPFRVVGKVAPCDLAT